MSLDRMALEVKVGFLSLCHTRSFALPVICYGSPVYDTVYLLHLWSLSRAVSS